MNAFSDFKPVHDRHIYIQQDQRVRVVVGLGCLQRFQSLGPVLDGGWAHSPTRKHFFQNAAVGCVVIYEKHG